MPVFKQGKNGVFGTQTGTPPLKGANGTKVGAVTPRVQVPPALRSPGPHPHNNPPKGVKGVEPRGAKKSTKI